MYLTTPIYKPVKRFTQIRKYNALINRLTTDVGCQEQEKLWLSSSYAVMTGFMLSEAQPNDLVIVPAQSKDELWLSEDDLSIKYGQGKVHLLKEVPSLDWADESESGVAWDALSIYLSMGEQRVTCGEI